MGSSEFGHKTERRRKRVVRLIVAALAVTVLVITAAYRWRSAPADEHPVNPRTLPSDVNQRLSGYSFTRSDNGQRIFTVHAARTTAFKDGNETVLNDVWVEVFGRAGNRHDLIRTRQCTYNSKTGRLFAEQNVQIELNAPSGAFPGEGAASQESGQAPSQSERAAGESDAHPPIYLETSRLSLIRNGTLVTSDAPVKFHVGPASGTAQGLNYATRQEWLELKKDVVMDFQMEDGPQASAPYRVEAASLRFVRKTGVVTLGGPVRVSQEGSHATAESGKVFLNPENRITAAELVGQVKAYVASQTTPLKASAQRLRAQFEPPALQLRTLVAQGDVRSEWISGGKIIRLASRDFRMNLEGASSRPKNGVATGDVRISAIAPHGALAKADRQPEKAGDLSGTNQELTAAAVRFAFAPGGRWLKTASTVGGGKLELIPQNTQAGKRVITAEPLGMGFDGRGRLATLRGHKNARIVFVPPPTAPPGTPAAESTSDRLEAAFDPASQDLRAVDQIGNYHYQEADRQAFADRAHYETTKETIALTGHPRLQDVESRARADRVLFDTRANTAEGLGHVRATHLDNAAKAPTAGRGDPTNVVADRMIARRDSRFIHYEGHVRAWHGTDVLESASIDVYKAQGRVHSGSRVLSSFLQPAAVTPDAGKSAPVTISADSLEFLEDGREAIYRGHVQLETENTTMRSDRLNVFFSTAGTAESSVVDRAVAEGSVTVVQPARRATGEHAEYFAATGKILLTGGPPTLYDAEKGFTTGQRLTFFLRDDRIFLDGGEESPTFSRHRIPQ